MSSSPGVVPGGAATPSMSPTSSSSDELEVEDVIEEKVEFHINTIVKQLEMQPTVEWRIDNINVTQRFRQYQRMAIDKLKKNGLKWGDTFEILALSSIIVLRSPYPYPNFTNLEWHKIIQTASTTHHSIIEDDALTDHSEELLVIPSAVAGS